jgi:hypothetical protein
MARRRFRYQGIKRAGQYAMRGYSRFRAGGMTRRKAFYKAGGGSILFGAAGVALGYIAPRVLPYQDLVITAIAVAPAIVPRSMMRIIPWQVQKAAGGYVIGSMARALLPNILGVGAATGGSVYN